MQAIEFIIIRINSIESKSKKSYNLNDETLKCKLFVVSTALARAKD